MINLIRGEFYKLRKSKYFIGMIFLALVASFFFIVQYDRDVQISQLQKVNGEYSITYAFEYIIESSFLFAIFGGEFIAGDFKNSNISKSFIYGYRRNTVILSKIIVFIIFSLFLELIYATNLVIYTSMNYGFCEVFNLTTVLYLARVIVLGIMYNVAMICIIAMISIITKSNFCTIISPIIFYISCLLAFTGNIYVSRVFSYMPNITGMGAICRFSSNAAIIRCVASSFLTFIITIGTSLLYVKHKDIK